MLIVFVHGLGWGLQNSGRGGGNAYIILKRCLAYDFMYVRLLCLRVYICDCEFECMNTYLWFTCIYWDYCIIVCIIQQELLKHITGHQTCGQGTSLVNKNPFSLFKTAKGSY